MEATKETVGWPANLKIRAFRWLLGEPTTVNKDLFDAFRRMRKGFSLLF